jgi:hypothetical protein
MDQRQLLRMSAVARMALGASLLALPGIAGRRVVGEVADSPGGRLLLRVAGVRDLVIGYGTFTALAEDRDPATWARLGAVCDATDAASSLLGIRRLPTPTALLSIVAGSSSAVLGFRAAADMP